VYCFSAPSSQILRPLSRLLFCHVIVCSPARVVALGPCPGTQRGCGYSRGAGRPCQPAASALHLLFDVVVSAPYQAC
jgi:hypothetical protein